MTLRRLGHRTAQSCRSQRHRGEDLRRKMRLSATLRESLQARHSFLNRAHEGRGTKPTRATRLTLHEVVDDPIADPVQRGRFTQLRGGIEPQSTMQVRMREDASDDRPDMLSDGRLGTLISAAPPLDKLVIHAGHPNRKPPV